MSVSTRAEFMQKLEVLCRQYGMKPEMDYDILTFVPMDINDEKGCLEYFISRNNPIVSSVYWKPFWEKKQ